MCFRTSAHTIAAMFRYPATIFLGALLIFAVQPILAKYLLPWFGGGPAVWTACLLFFQAALLLGYLWAHLLDRWLAPRRQAQVQVALALLSVALLAGLWTTWAAPILPSDGFKPDGSGLPVARILLILTVGVGLPYGLLSSASPLLQAWYRDRRPDRPPWKLYALSNLGSLLGLLAYPFVVEPLMGSVRQGQVWSALYLIFAAGLVACAWPALRQVKLGAAGPRPDDPASGSNPAPGLGRRVLWFALPAAASVLLLAGTNQICQEVAVVPFLWVLPLSLYLLTYILAFQWERAYRRFWTGPLFALGAAAAVLALYMEYELRIGWQVLIYSAVIFAGCLLCHGELVRLKPSPRRLTGFYLTVALGGAAGGAFVALLAPVLFVGFWEFHLALVACAGLHLAALWLDPGSWIQGRLKALKLSGPALAVAGLAVALAIHPGHFLRGTIEASRNFYGLLRVKLTHPGHPKFFAHDLFDGQILHGFQLQSSILKRVPTSYFSNSSGLGLALTHHPARAEGRALAIGLIGLGIGTAAAHGRAGDRLTFYEINPQVIRLARGEGGSFSFLPDSQAQIEIVEGDARVSLERELAAGQRRGFDVFVVDAFQSDAIPIHLLTLQAMRLYLEHLAEGGLLILHVTNLNLSLEPVVDRLATELDLVVASVRDEGDGWVSLRSHWMLLTRDPSILAVEAIAAKASLPQQLAGPAPLWTDDHSSILPILR